MKIYLLLLCLGSAFFYLLFRMYFPCTKSSTVITQYYTLEEGTKKYVYNRSLPIIFIGGMPGSGLTRLSVMLDAHPDVRCGEETGIIPHLLRLNEQWTNYRIEFKRLQAAGIAGKVLDSAMASFILEIIANQGSAAPRLCNKDPFTLLSAVYLHSLFPRAKFVFLIRDGRAVVHSMITKNVSIADFDLNDYRQCLSEWNAKMLAMFSQCLVLGSEICMPVHYEQIVLQPEPSMRSIANFLDIPWSKSVLHPDELVKRALRRGKSPVVTEIPAPGPVTPSSPEFWGPTHALAHEHLVFHTLQLRRHWINKSLAPEICGKEEAIVIFHPTMGPLIMFLTNMGLELCVKATLYKAWEEAMITDPMDPVTRSWSVV